MLDERDQPAGHESAGPDGLAGRVTSVTSTTPRAVVISMRRPARRATISNVWTPWPVSTTASTRSPFMRGEDTRLTAAHLLAHERHVREREHRRRRGDQCHELRPDHEQALIQRKQATDGAAPLSRRDEVGRDRAQPRIEDDRGGLLVQLVGRDPSHLDLQRKIGNLLGAALAGLWRDGRRTPARMPTISDRNTVRTSQTASATSADVAARRNSTEHSSA